MASQKVRSATLLRAFQDFDILMYAFTPENPRALPNEIFA
jgi:hypothetical protein